MNSTAPLIARNFAPPGYADGVDVELQAGEILALTGPYSTSLMACLRCIAGIEFHFAGELRVAGIDVATMNEREWLQLRQRSGLVSSRVPLLSTMDALMNVMLPLIYHHPRQTATAKAVAQRLLDDLGFEGPRHVLPAELQATHLFYLQMARELILEPGILFIEEPFSMQSAGDWPVISQQLVSLAAARKIAIVIATMNLAFIQKHAPRTLFIDADNMELHETASWIGGSGSAASRAFLDKVTTWPRGPVA